MGKKGRAMRRASAVGALVTSLVVALGLMAPAAHADYAPRSQDVVGVGSDTVQYIMDFVADGFIDGSLGYNAANNVNKIVNFDATPDANARLAYGNAGVGTGTCPPGTGGTAGTGNSNTTHSDKPCTLNPTIVLQEGLSPVLRPNGTGAGRNALRQDITNGTHYIDYTRASSAWGANSGGTGDLISVQVGNDPFAMMVSDTTHAPATGLSAATLKTIYEASTGTPCKTWADVGGTGSNTIIPILPQVGSGTRSAFLSAIGTTEGALGNCATVAEENDPLAIIDSSSPDDAIAPMSGGRLNLFQGKDGSNASTGAGGYFGDPSCPFGVTTPAACVGASKVLTPDVHLQTTGSAWHTTRPLYVYFRESDVEQTAPFGTNHPFQPGTTLNWVRALFYNPCSAGQTGCVTISGTQYGPGGQPFVATLAGQSLISLAGIAPTYVVTVHGP